MMSDSPQSTGQTPPTRRRRLFSVLRLVVFIGVVAWAWLWLANKSGDDPRGWLEAMRSTDPLVFIACIAILPIVGFPIAACYLYAGAAFGFLYGWLYCLLGLFVSMSAGYWTTRSFLRTPLQNLLAAPPRRIPEPTKRHQLRTVLLVRLVPGLSFAMQNALLALLNIPFAKYIGASFLAQGLQAALMCAIGSVGRTPRWASVSLIAAAVLGLCLLAHFGIRRGWRQPVTSGQGITNAHPVAQPLASTNPAPAATCPATNTSGSDSNVSGSDSATPSDPVANSATLPNNFKDTC